ncbi:SpoIIIAH-like family protein [Clostridium cylindrosporum]|uniref:Stage III sporulation protein AH n=1 Tax=Clostridium cylindrosporum DSM 605 TaxID=1121307 RepID=A0A0J8G0M2_CLOCY|nr:SpoIIIAH-like family protein [Clostridium cylindrosporum]KMT21346.1 stage III sporulation protein AH [Clostridium cylindrosporum DSM 605]
MPNFRKQTVIIAVLIGLIGCASFFAKKFNDSFKDTDMVLKQGTEVTETLNKKVASSSKSFYSEGRMARENQRTTMKQELESIVNNKNATKESKEKASQKLMGLIEKGEKESKIETMVKEKGFEEALCIIDDNGVEISVKSSEKLTSEKVNQIKDIAVRSSGVAPSGIIIKQNQ